MPFKDAAGKWLKKKFGDNEIMNRSEKRQIRELDDEEREAGDAMYAKRAGANKFGNPVNMHAEKADKDFLTGKKGL